MPRGIAFRIKRSKDDIDEQAKRQTLLRRAIVNYGGLKHFADNAKLSVRLIRAWNEGARRIDDEFVEVIQKGAAI